MRGDKVLMVGNEAIGEAAIRAGCQLYFAYPITPQSELPQLLARRMPEEGRVFLQAESEVAAINMVYGAAGAGSRVMTSSSSPGISLKQEGISYIAGAELPCVIVNIVRGGPGLGGIQPAQSDYFQATKGGGHGDYRLIVLAPASVQEMVDLTALAFDLADKYRNPVMILGDGVLGQMMEPVEFGDIKPEIPSKPWATTGRKGRDRNVVNSLYLDPNKLEEHNWHLQAKYRKIEEEEIRFDTFNLDDAQLIIVAYGISARIARTAIEMARADGIAAGLLRPITLFPFPTGAIAQAAEKARAFLSLELSAGQMVEDVRLAVNGKRPVHFYGRTGGIIPTPQEVYGEIKKIAGEEVAK
ncbi:MAG: 3-methyl-2-oxobutanoate dehydrogenase subunit VorB [Firmicutes bacterium]|nr:3-methyl-2-oxobutanoate dehydrogenase subunit VorB [Bacillota bacterium]